MSYLACQFFIFESHVFVLKIPCFRSQSLMSPGCKTPSVSVVYTPFTNLKKTPDMEVGQVGFHDRKKVSLHDNKRERRRGRHHAIWYELSGCMECSVAIACFVDVVYRKKPLPCMPLPCMSAIFGVSLAIQKQLPKIKHTYLLSCM